MKNGEFDLTSSYRVSRSAAERPTTPRYGMASADFERSGTPQKSALGGISYPLVAPVGVKKFGPTPLMHRLTPAYDGTRIPFNLMRYLCDLNVLAQSGKTNFSIFTATPSRLGLDSKIGIDGLMSALEEVERGVEVKKPALAEYMATELDVCAIADAAAELLNLDSYRGSLPLLRCLMDPRNAQERQQYHSRLRLVRDATISDKPEYAFPATSGLFSFGEALSASLPRRVRPREFGGSALKTDPIELHYPLIDGATSLWLIRDQNKILVGHERSQDSFDIGAGRWTPSKCLRQVIGQLDAKSSPTPVSTDFDERWILSDQFEGVAFDPLRTGARVLQVDPYCISAEGSSQIIPCVPWENGWVLANMANRRLSPGLHGFATGEAEIALAHISLPLRRFVRSLSKQRQDDFFRGLAMSSRKLAEVKQWAQSDSDVRPLPDLGISDADKFIGAVAVAIGKRARSILRRKLPGQATCDTE